MCYHEKYFQAFPILMAAIRRRTAENMRSTAELSIFLLILRPKIPPPIPPAIIQHSDAGEHSGIVRESAAVIILAIWLKRMIYRLLDAALLESILK